MSLFTVFYSVLCSSYNVRISGISSTCGQHMRDMLSALSMFFLSCSSSSTYVMFAFPIGIACFLEFQVLLIDIKMS